ncbi:hypothetical protein AKJ39_04065 [candidate division MSBL1 archaeon SCGC-AAA259J03]|uniref:DUF1116 domain-containing protein n=4 Tax=candidate division MSBL1 TaxID=215777 RepID=A0A133UQ94_9EURY|nr:hypothetical protein AKJ61_01025 [candidate division MSBL1 archaeon SCGC-AAA259B11]KXA93422.1 hypothetical protein AKJ66_02095 [candidate division MSBL1 archaeon SCGC-AAA259E22]KXA96391.1 hypothetical protein AKJ38_03355 [candidate division MSBL1 archaeon SCGC-AAA259I14]KXA96838.1 hypothetical protein AKJ39_04065 [candidate division MSBL1 archaeon SCGC-AAA259J03]
MGKIEEANEEALEKFKEAQPVATGLAKASDVIPDMDDRTFLHAGPPVEWERMSGPTRGAVIGALIFEGLADDEEEAKEIAASGDIEFDPCHDHDAVGPMAGIISPSMSVYIIENQEHGNKAYCNLNEGLGEVLRYGAYSEKVLDKLKWMEEVEAPILNSAFERSGPIDLKEIISQALHMGDDGHARDVAMSLIFLKEMAPHILETDFETKDKKKVLEFMGENQLTFLNLLMPAGKAMIDAAHGVEYSTLVTALTRNGTDFGIRVSGLPGQWFTAPAPKPDTLFFPGFKEGDQGRDIGDSAICETIGLGGFASAAAPMIVQVVGGTPDDAVARTREMREITIDEHPGFTIPFMNFRGVPIGIDTRKVVEKDIRPFINTGVAHKDPGVGGVGFGLVRAPIDCFKKALKAFADKYK